MPPIPIIVLAAVFLLIAIRQVGNLRLKIWQIMALGAIAVLLSNQITPEDALKSINMDVMLFLFAMFVIGKALEDSGYLSYLSYKIFKKAQTADYLLFLILFVMGIGSAILVNDTLAIIGTPVVLMLAKQHKISPKPLLLALAFSLTIGSVMSPIGNPQNFLIGLGIKHPFITFLRYLLVPTALSLLSAFLILKLFYREEFGKRKLVHAEGKIKDPELAKLSKVSLGFLLMMILAKLTSSVFYGYDFKLTYIALISAIPILILSRSNVKIVKGIDWATLVFFASMFVLMESAWQTGFFQGIIETSNLNIISIPVIFGVSLVLSQFISNVPLVALYLPMLMHAGASIKGFMALAAGSTIAGNLFILGAASNVIIIQHAEKHKETITFWEFAKVGVPLTIVNFLIYFVFLA